MTLVNMAAFEHHNVEILNGERRVRRGYYQHIAATDIAGSSTLIAGFSVEDPTSGEAIHYLFLLAGSTATLYIVDEQYVMLHTYVIGTLSSNPYITYAIQDNQILINCPEFTDVLYGTVGGSIAPAVATASVNPDTTAITLPTGLVCSFADRVVIAQYDTLYFNDEQYALQTFVAENAIPFPGTIYDIFQADAGLYVITNNAVFLIPADATSQGQIINPFIQKISSYQAFSSGNVVGTATGTPIGLSKQGWVVLGQDKEVPLASYNQKRAISAYVGVSNSGDYRDWRIFPTERGFVINVDGKLAEVDLRNNFMAWHYRQDESDFNMVGIGKTSSGTDLFIMDDGIYERWGNQDTGDSTQRVLGISCGIAPSDASRSNVVRFITTASDNVGLLQKCSIRGNIYSSTTPASTDAANIIDTSVWDPDETYVANEVRSARFGMGERTDTLAIEVAIEGTGSACSYLDVVVRGQGRSRA